MNFCKSIICAIVFVFASSCTAQKSDREKIDENIAIILRHPEDQAQRRAAAKELGLIGKEAIPALFKIMRVENRFALGDISYAIAHMRPFPLEEMIDGLEHEEQFVRGGCSTILIATHPQSKEAVKALRKVLDDKDNDPGVQLAAAMALGAIGPLSKPALPTLLEATQAKNGDLRNSAIDSIAIIDSDSLKLFPYINNQPTGFFANMRAQRELAARQSRFDIGRLEYGRLDLNQDWKLEKKELEGMNVLAYLKGTSPTEYLKLQKSDEWLTFEQTGELAVQLAVLGYIDGRNARLGKKDPEIEETTKDSRFRTGLAKLLVFSLLQHDHDKDGVLSKEELDEYNAKITSHVEMLQKQQNNHSQQ